MLEVVFFKSILEKPDDEMARLAFADWLMEQDNPEHVARGEFIQVQCTLARRQDPSTTWETWVNITTRVPALLARERVLLKQHGDRWARAFQNMVTKCAFRRGFIEDVTLSTDDFERHGEQLFQLTPIRCLRLSRALRGLSVLAKSPRLAQVEELDLTGYRLNVHEFRTLLASPHLKRLHTLDLRRASRFASDLQGFRDLVVWKQIRTLDLRGSSNLDLQVLCELAETRPAWEPPLALRLYPQRGDRPEPVPDGNLTLLCIHLQACFEEPTDDCGRSACALAARAGTDEERAIPVLERGLHDGHRRVRAAAAHMLARLGQRALPALPGLIQRMYDGNPRVRAPVRRTLASLLRLTPVEMHRWWCLLAWPRDTAENNLQAALRDSHLPQEVRSQFAELCNRRAQWWSSLQDKASPSRNTSASRERGRALDAAARTVLGLAEAHAARKPKGQTKEARAKARHKESAWLLGRLCALLQQHLSANSSESSRDEQE